MVKKIFKVCIKIILFIIMYLLQLYVFNNITFFGIKGDIILAFLVIITMTGSGYEAIIYAVICGLLSDIIFDYSLGKYIMIYLLIVSVLTTLKNIYKQDSKMAIIIFVVIGVIICETVLGIFNTMADKQLFNVVAYLITIVKSCIINIFLAFIVYMILKKINEEKDNVYIKE